MITLLLKMSVCLLFDGDLKLKPEIGVSVLGRIILVRA
jgi:hypothetical protein